MKQRKTRDTPIDVNFSVLNLNGLRLLACSTLRVQLIKTKYLNNYSSIKLGSNKYLVLLYLVKNMQIIGQNGFLTRFKVLIN